MRIDPRVKNIIREYAEALIVAFILAMIIRTFVVQAFKIPTGSMRMTLIEGDRILVNKFIYRFQDPQRWDVVVFKYPEDQKKDFIKRLIAKPGETIQIVNGDIMINEKIIEKPDYLKNLQYVNDGPYGREGARILVPEDSYFVMGDNTNSSKDSRYWGFVKRKQMKGKAMVIYWPLTRIGRIR